MDNLDVIEDLFNDSYDKFVEGNSVRESKFDILLTEKTKVPPGNLPRGMREHKLKSPLNDFYECHLGGDILVLYTLDNNMLTLYIIVTHDDLKKSKQKALAGKLDTAKYNHYH